MDIVLTSSGGVTVRGSLIRPAVGCRGVIVLIHGLGEHFGRYRDWAGRFVKEGYAVAGVDLPGHGISDGRRGHIASYNLVDEFIGSLLWKVSGEIPDVPVILYGHSLGGGIVLRYLILKKPDIKSAIVTSPWLKLSFEPPRLKLYLAMVVRKIFPGLVQPSGLIVNYISRDPDIVKAYLDDPLVHNRISVSLFYNAVSAASFSLENAGGIAVPLLLMHGSGDLITSPDGSRALAGSSPLTTLKIWEEGYHELHNDIISGEVFDFIRGWLTAAIVR